jgi:hypothetical protein
MTHLAKYPQNNIKALIEECLLTIMVDDAIKAREAQLALCDDVAAGPKDTVDPVGVALGTIMAVTCASTWLLTLAALMGKVA